MKIIIVIIHFQSSIALILNVEDGRHCQIISVMLDNRMLRQHFFDYRRVKCHSVDQRYKVNTVIFSISLSTCKLFVNGAIKKTTPVI